MKAAAAGEDAGPHRRKAAKAEPGRVTTVTLSGSPVQVCFHGRLLWAEFTTEALGAVYNVLLARAAPTAMRHFRARKAKE